MPEEQVTKEVEAITNPAIELSEKDKDFVKRFDLKPEHLKYKEIAEKELAAQ